MPQGILCGVWPEILNLDSHVCWLPTALMAGLCCLKVAKLYKGVHAGPQWHFIDTAMIVNDPECA